MTLPGPMPIVLRRVYRSEAVDTHGNAIASSFRQWNELRLQHVFVVGERGHASGSALQC
jgi:hypothetical protein